MEIEKFGCKIKLGSHNSNHANSVLAIIPIYPVFGIETIYNDKTLKEMANAYARLTNQYKFSYHIFIQIVFITLMKKIKKVMKLTYLIIYIRIIN